jgi:hypothetical protein
MDAKPEKRMVRLELTEAQQKQVRQSTGLRADSIELTIEELEERINPGVRLTNHNDTLLA